MIAIMTWHKLERALGTKGGVYVCAHNFIAPVLYNKSVEHIEVGHKWVIIVLDCKQLE